MSLILEILKALIALPKIGMMLQEAIAVFIAEMDEARRERIQNAYIQIARAKTKEEKQAALDRWFHAGGN